MGAKGQIAGTIGPGHVPITGRDESCGYGLRHVYQHQITAVFREGNPTAVGGDMGWAHVCHSPPGVGVIFLPPTPI